MRRSAFHRPFARVPPRDLPVARCSVDDGDDDGLDHGDGGDDERWRRARKKLDERDDLQHDDETSVTHARIGTTRTARPPGTATETSRRQRRLTYD